MTTGFETQQTTYGAILKAAPKPQIIGAKLEPSPLSPPISSQDPAPEPRSFIEQTLASDETRRRA